MTSLKRRILIVDDDSETREFLQDVLSQTFETILASDGDEGFRVAQSRNPHLVLLDIGMPKIDGLTACEMLRSHEATRHIPVIMLTGASDVDQRIRAFNTGADDFITKPYKTKELIARIESKLRRITEREETDGGTEQLACGNLIMNLPKIEARLSDKTVPLSVLEFSLLKYFIQNKDRVMGRDRILKDVWKDAIVSDRTVDTHIAFLRKKLAGFDHVIATVYGAGYVLKIEE